MMLRHHIKVAVRNIRKQGFYAFLNFLGLSVGLVLGLFVLLLVKHELNYDASFSDSGRIYRMATEGVLGSNVINSATSPMPLGNMLREMDEVDEVVRFIPGANNVVASNDIQYNENGFLFGDSNFFQLFDVELIRGNNSEVLRSAKDLVITESMAGKYFGDEDPVGKKLEREEIQYTITGVCADMPASTHFEFGFIASINTIDEILLKKGDSAYVENWKADWLHLNCYTYIKLQEGVDRCGFVEKVNRDKDKLISPQVLEVMRAESSTDSVELAFISQKIQSIHFASHLDGELKVNSNPIYIKLFVFIAIFVMLTTCVNFINLTTAKLRNKYQEVGYRQLVGASRGQLMTQFMTEAIVYSFGAMFLSMVLLELLLPFFNSFFELNLQFNFFKGWIEFFGILLILLVVGFIAGSFPAFFFSGRKPEKLIAGEYKIGKAGFILRGLMVASQFAVAMFLVLVASAMWWQINYVKNNDHGFKTDNIILIERGHAVREDFQGFKSELLKVGDVQKVSACTSLPGDDYFQGTFRIKNDSKDKVVMLPLNYVDQDYFELMGLKLKAGRFLNSDLGDSLGIMLNVQAIKQLEFRKPLGEEIEVFGNADWSLSTVGVVKDFHHESYFTKIEPLALILLSERMRFEYVLIDMNSIEEGTIAEIKKVWDEYSNGAPFEYSRLKERIDGLYEEDVRISKIISVFAILSLFVAMMGVIALVAFIIEYKASSIGIKKVLGAPRQSIILQVFSMFGFYVVSGVVLAILPAYGAIVAWGNSYAYFDFISVWVFIIWALALMSLSFLAVLYQTFRGASVSPLRNWHS